ncbi:MAG: glycosyltransferase family 2 protein [Tidjanibacter sp.]|nr:glycosyltransferase family 2 protein [Tidjanibacter sp.]
MNSNSKPRFSVIIPLYNKEQEVEATIRSVLAQTLQPVEIVVVDDGSTDSSAKVVESIGSPLVRLIRQANAGECAARNRAMAEATGDWFALVDADDGWKPQFLEEVAAMIDRWPDCGIYSTAFDIVSPTGTVRAKTLTTRGPVENFWRESVYAYVTIPSATVLSRRVVEELGGFPEGMKMGGDQFMWIKVASRYGVCFSPKALCLYSMVASNRSSSIYTPEQTPYRLEDFLKEALWDEEQNYWRREFIAKCAIGKALTLTAKGDEEFGRSVVRNFGYTEHYRRGLRKLKVLLALPRCMRSWAHHTYNKLAWVLAHRGL